MKWIRLLVWLSVLVAPQALQAASPVVVFDEGHGQAFLVGGEQPLDLSGLAGVFRSAGYEVRSSQQPLAAEGLSGVDALVISGAFQPLTADEVTTIRDFVARGGRLAVMLHVAPPLDPLLQVLEVDFTNGTLREHLNVVADNPQDFRVKDLKPHPLTEGLTDFTVYGAWALRGTVPGVAVIGQTSAHGWVDLNHDRRLGEGDAMQVFAVAVAGALDSGQFVVFGDDAIFQNRFLEGGNLALAANLARWMWPPTAGR